MANNKYNHQITVSITNELYNDVKSVSGRIGISVSELVRGAIYVMLEAEKEVLEQEANDTTKKS